MPNTDRLRHLAMLLALLGASGADAIETEFGRCRDVPEAAARLACYDAIPYATPRAGRPVPAASGVPAAASPGAAASAPLSATERFGLPERARTDELPSITSAVGSDFFGWAPNERIRLQNGQVWEVVDGSSGSVAAANRKVTIRRGALGSFFLDFEGLNSSPRVKRVK